ncbi:MAG: peptidoglycan-binding protein [Minisyncoccia bacterium]
MPSKTFLKIPIVFALVTLTGLGCANFALAQTPSTSSGQATVDTNALILSLQKQILQLLTQIQTLQKEVTELKTETGIQASPILAPSTVEGSPFSPLTPISDEEIELPEFTRSLSLGSRGDDVRKLQEFLARDREIYPEGLATGFYGPRTVEAVKRWQRKHNVEAVGTVGPKTIAKFRELGQGVVRDLMEQGTPSGTIPPGLLTAPGIQRQMATTTPPVSMPATTTPATPLHTQPVTFTTPNVPTVPILQSSSSPAPLREIKITNESASGPPAIVSSNTGYGIVWVDATAKKLKFSSIGWDGSAIIAPRSIYEPGNTLWKHLAIKWTGSEYGVILAVNEPAGTQTYLIRIDSQGNLTSATRLGPGGISPHSGPAIAWNDNQYGLAWNTASNNGISFAGYSPSQARVTMLKLNVIPSPVACDTAIEWGRDRFGIMCNGSIFSALDTNGNIIVSPIKMTHDQSYVTGFDWQPTITWDGDKFWSISQDHWEPGGGYSWYGTPTRSFWPDGSKPNTGAGGSGVAYPIYKSSIAFAPNLYLNIRNGRKDSGIAFVRLDKNTIKLGEMIKFGPTFIITENALSNLKSAGIPDDILAKLQGLKDQEIVGEENFLSILKSKIGEEDTLRFKVLILKHARLYSVMISDPWKNITSSADTLGNITWAWNNYAIVWSNTSGIYVSLTLYDIRYQPPAEYCYQSIYYCWQYSLLTPPLVPMVTTPAMPAVPATPAVPGVTSAVPATPAQPASPSTTASNELKITYPNGGETWYKGNSYTITWQNPLASGFIGKEKYYWNVLLKRGNTAWQADGGVPVTQSSYTWSKWTGWAEPIPNAEDFKVGISLVDTCAAQVGGVCPSANISITPTGGIDYSDGYFTATSTPVATTPTTSLPDLKVDTTPSITPSSPNVNQPATVGFRIANYDPTRTAYISNFTPDYAVGTVLDSNDISSGRASGVTFQKLSHDCPTTLAPFGSCYVQFTLTYTTGGAKTIYVKADPNNKIAEANETNNSLPSSFNVIDATGDITPPTATLAVGYPNLTAQTQPIYIGSNTNEETKMTYEYGLTTSYGSIKTLSDNYLISNGAYLPTLSSGTTYHIRAKATDRAGNIGYSQDYVFTTASPNTPPAITSGPHHTPTDATPKEAISIEFGTSSACDSSFQYGLSTSYGTSKTPGDPTNKTSHYFFLTGLTANTTYYYKITCAGTGGTLEQTGSYTTGNTGNTTSPSTTTSTTTSAVLDSLNGLIKKLQELLQKQGY